MTAVQPCLSSSLLAHIASRGPRVTPACKSADGLCGRNVAAVQAATAAAQEAAPPGLWEQRALQEATQQLDALAALFRKAFAALPWACVEGLRPTQSLILSRTGDACIMTRVFDSFISPQVCLLSPLCQVSQRIAHTPA